MKRLIPHIFLALGLLAAMPAFAASPGFDCARATRQIDRAICKWGTIALLDGQMADTYQTALMAQDGDDVPSISWTPLLSLSGPGGVEWRR